MAKSTGNGLRSSQWFEGMGHGPLIHRAWMRAEGLPSHVFAGKPVIGICNSFSELNNCNAHLRQLAEAVKRGVWEAGGLPLEFPTISLGEVMIKPTTMLYRNLMSMDVEEMIRANPLDAVVLLCGCDKTTPAQLMGAASAGLPAIMLPGGPMLKGVWRGRELGSGADAGKLADEHKVGRLTDEELIEIESCFSRSAGHCMVMGTASTMASLVEALGMTLPGAAAIPAPDSRRYALAHESGMRAVALAREGVRPADILTADALENAIRVLMALGGSTNGVIHMTAVAGRLGIPLQIDEFDRISRDTPFIADIRPSGRALMEDLFDAGGIPAVMSTISSQLHLDALTVNGRTVGENLDGVEVLDPEIIRPLDRPLAPEGGIAVLHGNIAPGGAVVKQTAASPDLISHRGRAVVFEDRDDMMRRIDDPDLDVDAGSVLVLKNAGPKGAPGMPEWGSLPIPRKLLEIGIKDLVRISDARMSGTSFGTIVLHVTPEAAVGGPLAAVRTGDWIELDVGKRRLHLDVSDAEIATRLAELKPRPPYYTRGYGRMFVEHVLQADQGCDFDFLVGSGTGDTDRVAQIAGSRRTKRG